MAGDSYAQHRQVFQVVALVNSTAVFPLIPKVFIINQMYPAFRTSAYFYDLFNNLNTHHIYARSITQN